MASGELWADAELASGDCELKLELELELIELASDLFVVAWLGFITLDELLWLVLELLVDCELLIPHPVKSSADSRIVDSVMIFLFCAMIFMINTDLSSNNI